VLLDAYGITADVERIAYYRAAWDASDDEGDPLAG
jgi:kanamycin kinase